MLQLLCIINFLAILFLFPTPSPCPFLLPPSDPTLPPHPFTLHPPIHTPSSTNPSLQLNCSQSTVAREVIRLTVMQLDKARRQKGKPGTALTEKDLSDFYMTAVCGDQETILEEDSCVSEVHQRWPNCHLFLHRHSEDSFVTEHGPCTSV